MKVGFVYMFMCALLAVAFAEIAGKRSRKSPCSKQLAEIVYEPDTCTAQYLRRISRELKEYGPLLFTVQNTTILATFAAKYNVAVTLYNALGEVIYPVVDPIYYAMYRTTARAYLNLNPVDIVPDNATPASFYEYLQWNTNGELLLVSISLLLADSPLGICC